MNTYKTAEAAGRDRADLEILREALDVALAALCRDPCGLWVLHGSRGYASTWGDGMTWHLIVYETTPRRWNFHKIRLGFAELMQDGEAEGCLRLHRLPTPEEAEIIREIVGLRKQIRMTPERLDLLRRVGFKKTA